jgi:hypothetical protein
MKCLICVHGFSSYDRKIRCRSNYYYSAIGYPLRIVFTRARHHIVKIESAFVFEPLSLWKRHFSGTLIFIWAHVISELIAYFVLIEAR